MAGRTGHAVTVNGTVPAPLLRLREGHPVKIRVENRLEEETLVGFRYERSFGETATFRRADGEDSEALALVAGVRFWF